MHRKRRQTKKCPLGRDLRNLRHVALRLGSCSKNLRAFGWGLYRKLGFLTSGIGAVAILFRPQQVAFWRQFPPRLFQPATARGRPPTSVATVFGGSLVQSPKAVVRV